MPLLVLVLIALLSGVVAAGLASLFPRPRESALTRHVRLAPRLDPETATGLALTLALVLLVMAGLVVAVLAFVIRTDPDAIGLDRAAAEWGDRHATDFTTDVLQIITDVGRPGTIAILAVIFAIFETARTRNRWVIPFMLVVLAGNGILTTTIKHLADRVRPALNPVAETLGPSFPSGHSSWSAAFFAAAALLLARGAGRRGRIVLAGAAAACAATIAATRVLLDVHWLSDVVAGVALAWAWFAVCAIAFGGRLLEFGATAREMGARDAPGARVPTAAPPARAPERST
jgi:membrane-associated phospholipid phosphatase